MVDDINIGEVESWIDGSIGAIEIRRPPKNFLDYGVLSTVLAMVRRFEATPDCRVILLCSEGKHFSAGADLGEGADPNKPGQPHIYDAAVELFDRTLPIVVAVQGAAIGAGFGLALAADLRVADTSARFSATFTKLGFHHGFGMSVTLPRVVGETKALELLLTGRTTNAEEALRIGLITDIANPSQLRERAMEAAKEIAMSAPLAIRSTYRTQTDGLAQRIREALVHERSEQERLMTTGDFRRGVAAVTERRQPEFLGD